MGLCAFNVTHLGRSGQGVFNCALQPLMSGLGFGQTQTHGLVAHMNSLESIKTAICLQIGAQA